MLRPALLAGICCLGALLPAQRPSLWSTIMMPANATTAPTSLGTTVSFLTSNSVYLYSAITKQWTILPVAAPTPVFQANDYCIVRDGNLIHGYASHTGKVDTLTTSGSATVVSGAAGSSYVTLVSEGVQAWAFGAFHGKWESLTLLGTRPVMISNRLIAMLRDGPIVYGVSAHHGTFVACSADTFAAMQVSGDGEVGTASSPNMFRAFSAQQNSWVVQMVPNSTGLYQQSEFAMMWATKLIYAYSGLTGTLTSYTANTTITSVKGAEGVAAFADGTDLVLYSAARGQFVARTSAASPVVTFDYHYALLTEGLQLTPFSAITGALGPPIFGSFALTTNDEAAFAAVSGSPGYAYSPILNRWFPAPIGAPASISVVRSAVVLGDGNGAYWGFAARYGTWQPHVATAPGTFQAPASGPTFVALESLGNKAHVFDARLGRWASIGGAAPLTVQLSGNTLMVHDNQTAYGFGQPSGEWYAQPLSGAPTRFDTATSIGGVVHGTSLSVYSAHGSFSYIGRYPELAQAINLGGTLRMHQVAAPNSRVFLIVGLLPAFVDVRPIADGVLYVDPAFLGSMLLWPAPVDADGILDMDIGLPNDPAFVGLQLHLQNLVVEPGRQLWLSTSVAPVLF